MESSSSKTLWKKNMLSIGQIWTGVNEYKKRLWLIAQEAAEGLNK